MSPRSPAHDVAIIGMSCVFPGAGDLDTYWRNIVGGYDAITEVTEDRWSHIFYDPDERGPERLYCKRGGFVDEFAYFDALGWGVMPIAVNSSEPDQLMCLEVAARALADAGYADREFPRHKAGVILGRGAYLNSGMVRLAQKVRGSQEFIQLLRDLIPGVSEEELERVRVDYCKRVGYIGSDTVIGLVPNLAASRIANRLDLQGASFTIDAACASSLIAVERACADLRVGISDLVLAGGVHLTQDPAFWSVFCQLGALSRSQQIRPFDARADGLLMGEGLGVVVLKRLRDAEDADDRIYAVIRGTGSSSDGREASLMMPRVQGQMLALERAWADAGLDPSEPDSIGLIEAHGTGTPTGDAAELATLQRFFGTHPGGRRAGLGTVKSMIGHTMPAAGVAGLIKSALAVYHGILPPTLHCEEPRGGLEESRFRLITEAESWDNGATPRRVGVNAFGFGGINAHVILEQHGTSGGVSLSSPVVAQRLALMIAADTPEELIQMLDQGDFDSREGGCRLAVMNPTEDRIAKARKIVARGQAFRGRAGIWFSPQGLVSAGGGIAFLYPGVDTEFEPRIEDVEAFFGRSTDIVKAMPESTDVEVRGVGAIMCNWVVDGALRELKIRPDYLAGHSVGEWSGVIASECISWDAMQEFLPGLPAGSLPTPGVVFGAVGCGIDQAEAAIQGLEEIGVSHDNCPHQVILCGKEAAVDQALERLAAEGVLCQKLNFSSGFHSPLFREFVDTLHSHIEELEFKTPAGPLWSATHCKPYPDDPDEIRALFEEHLLRPVRFRELTEALYEQGARVFIQAGTGSLTGFVGDTLKGREHLIISANEPKRSGLEQLAWVTAALWVEGAEVDTERLIRPLGRHAKPKGMRLQLGAGLVRLQTALKLPHTAATEASEVLQEGDAVLAAFQANMQTMARSQREVLQAVRTGGTAAPAPAPAQRRELKRLRSLSFREQPFLMDHSFFEQPDDWTEPGDCFPLVPMTMSIGMMMDAARELDREAGRDRVLVVVEDVLAWKWMAVYMPIEVEIVAREESDDVISVRISDYIQCKVRMADAYPEAPETDSAVRDDLGQPPVSASEMYRRRWMFHGPAYQACKEFNGMGMEGMRGQIECLPAEGSLLDGAGQMFGFWITYNTTENRMALPVKLGSAHFYGPDPEDGAVFDCRVMIHLFGKRQVRGDIEISSGGRVWALLGGWEDRRFDTNERLWAISTTPGLAALCDPLPGSKHCCFLGDSFSNQAARDYFARRFLSGPEIRDYMSLSGRRQEDWLAGRIAAKDAVRRLLWDRGHGTIYPIEVEVSQTGQGAPRVKCRQTKEDLRISIAHCDGKGVCLVAIGRDVGVDMEKIEARPEGFETTAFRDEELALIADLGGEQRDEWITRMWCAKEAVAKMRGTGFQGNPKRFPVSALDGERAQVDGVWCQTLRQDDLVFGWTEEEELP